jgi:predicted RNase H-like HicB family nuclease
VRPEKPWSWTARRASKRKRGSTRICYSYKFGRRHTWVIARKASAVIEKDEHGYYAWHPELKGCQSQGASLEGALANIREAIELYLETLPPEERDDLLSQEILTNSIEVNT